MNTTNPQKVLIVEDERDVAELLAIHLKREGLVPDCVEDAEKALQSREIENNDIISTLLNLTDGIMSDILGMQAIATFNCSMDRIDAALLRPGRLIEAVEFKKFTPEEATRLSNGKITTSATLAEIFCGDNK